VDGGYLGMHLHYFVIISNKKIKQVLYFSAVIDYFWSDTQSDTFFE
jgi:hypothetical protein